MPLQKLIRILEDLETTIMTMQSEMNRQRLEKLVRKAKAEVLDLIDTDAL